MLEWKFADVQPPGANSAAFRSPPSGRSLGFPRLRTTGAENKGGTPERQAEAEKAAALWVARQQPTRILQIAARRRLKVRRCRAGAFQDLSLQVCQTQVTDHTPQRRMVRPTGRISLGVVSCRLIMPEGRHDG